MWFDTLDRFMNSKMFGRKIIKELNLILDMTFNKVNEFYKKPIKLVVHVVSNYIMLFVICCVVTTPTLANTYILVLTIVCKSKFSKY